MNFRSCINLIRNTNAIHTHIFEEISIELSKEIAEAVFVGLNMNTIKHNGITKGISITLSKKFSIRLQKECVQLF